MIPTPLTRNIKPGQPPLDLRSYERAGGYSAVRKALKNIFPDKIMEMVKKSNLRGRGGAGFPAGTKWSVMPPVNDIPNPRYIVANADEMEPGTFKDRLLLEGDPHLLIEGLILAAYTNQADTAYIFLRGEYTLAAERIETAIKEAQDSGYLGKNILGSPFSLRMILHKSVGRYMCGEETALLNALEGQRAIPRSKPPFPQQHGLWGRPTVVNNVETLCNVPGIVNNGPDWFLSLSHTNEGGTKIYGASGKVKKPGAWELPMGTPLREILEKHAGGMLEGYRLRGVIPGGASTDFLTADQLDVAMDFASMMKAGSRLGTGTMIVLDDRTCPVALVLNLQRFFARESCGWCTPCREGLPWVAKILEAIENGQGEENDLETLEYHVRMMGPLGRTFCALAPGAMEPLGSALKYFRDDFLRHIHERKCPWR